MTRALGGAVAAGAVLVALAVSTRAEPQRPGAGPPGVDSANVALLLDAARGLAPLQCELVLRAVRWDWGGFERAPDAPAEVRRVMDWGARRFRDPRAIGPLRAALEDRDTCVRRVSARLIGRAPRQPAVAALLDAFRSPNSETRQAAALGLGFADGHAGVEALIRGLDDASATVRAAAAWALGQIDDERAGVPLTRSLETDPDAAVRRAAAIALGEMH